MIPCARCDADPQPFNFGSPRRCAFPAQLWGQLPASIQFDPENWNCATMVYLLDLFDPEGKRTLYGEDESVDIVLAATRQDDAELNLRGWIVLSRYKRQGRCSSAVWVGDFFPARSVTYQLVQDTIQYWESRQKDRT